MTVLNKHLFLVTKRSINFLQRHAKDRFEKSINSFPYYPVNQDKTKSYNNIQPTIFLILCMSQIKSNYSTYSFMDSIYHPSSSCEGPSSRNSLMKKRKPPRFGSKIPNNPILFSQRMNHNDLPTTFENNVSKVQDNKNDDCPICKKYSQGPCGSLFQKWLNCIESKQHQESNTNTNSSDCDEYISHFQKCLQTHSDYYDKIDISEEESKKQQYQDVDTQQDLIKAWKEFIISIEDDKCKVKEIGKNKKSNHELEVIHAEFGKTREPDMEIHYKSKTGIVSFHSTHIISSNDPYSNNEKKDLLMAYVKDQDGVLIAAASTEDLLPYDDKMILRFGITDTTKDVTAFGLYGSIDSNNDTNNNNQELLLLRKTKRLPSTFHSNK